MIIFNQNIHIPVYWFSRLANHHKLILISIYIVLVPICPVYILVIHHILIILLWTLEFKPYPIFYRQWFHTAILFYILYLAFAVITSSSQMISLCIPYTVKINKYFLNILNGIISKKTNIYSNVHSIYRYFHLDIPLLLTRNYLLLLNYFNLYNFIRLTTSHEQLIVNLVSLVQYNKYKLNKIQESIIIVMLSSEIISILTSKLSYTKNCLILRGFNAFIIFTYAFYLSQLILYKYKKFLIAIINNTVYIIYSRELLMYDIDLWLLV